MAASATAQFTEKTTLNAGGAKHVITAVVDDSGNLMAVELIDGTFAAGANIPIGQARTPPLFEHPTKLFEQIMG